MTRIAGAYVPRTSGARRWRSGRGCSEDDPGGEGLRVRRGHGQVRERQGPRRPVGSRMAPRPVSMVGSRAMRPPGGWRTSSKTIRQGSHRGNNPVRQSFMFLRCGAPFASLRFALLRVSTHLAREVVLGGDMLPCRAHSLLHGSRSSSLDASPQPWLE